MMRFHAMLALCLGLSFSACGSMPADPPNSPGPGPTAEAVEISPQVDAQPAPPPVGTVDESPVETPAVPLTETAVDAQPRPPRGGPTLAELQALYAAMRRDIREARLEAGLERSEAWTDQLEFAEGDPRREVGSDVFLLSKFIENMIERERAGRK